MRAGILRLHLRRSNMTERGDRRYRQLTECRAGAALVFAVIGLFISIATSADQVGGATLEIAVPRLVHQPVLLFLVAENRVVDNTRYRSNTQARISSVMSTFDPPMQILPMGTTIDVVNKDPILHNTHVFDRNRTLFNLATPNADTTVQRTLSRPGLFGVRCDLHPSMNAWIAVVSSPYFAVIQKAGVFSIEDIKPGHYKVHIQRPDRQDQVIELQLKAREQRKIRLSP